MIARPCRRPSLRTRVLLAAAALTALSSTLIALPVSAAPPKFNDAEITLSLTSINPVSVTPGRTLSITGRVSSDIDVKDLYVRLEVGTSPFVSRSSIAEAASTPPLTTPVPNAFDKVGAVQGGSSRRFTIEISTDDLLLTIPGVYPMRIAASQGETGTAVTDVRSFLPWVPEGLGPSPTRLLMFWPLIDIPRRNATGAFDVPGLRQELAPHGRLTTLTTAGQEAPVTWIIDSSVLSDVEALGDPRSRQWLASLPDAVGTSDTAVLPYGDPDLAAVTAADQGKLLRQGTLRGSRIADRVLQRPVRTDLGWPADGAADSETIDKAHKSGSNLMLLDGNTMPLVDELPYTPSGRVSLTQPNVDLLLADPVASSLMASPASDTDEIVLSRQRFLAETLLHSLELPSDPRLLVVAPPRRWDPDPKWADTLVSAVRQATWLNPVSLDEAIRPSAPTVERADPTPTEASDERMLPPELVTRAAEAMGPTHTFSAILTRPNILARPILDALLTSVSTAYRTDHAAAQESVDNAIERLTTQRAQVRVVSRGGTLSDDRGDLPVTIRNQLDQTVVVKLSVTSDDPLRLRVETPPDRIRVKPEGLESVSISLDAVTSGRLGVQAQILTPDSVPYSDPVHLSVDVRAYGQVALIVFGAAAALMLIAGVIRTVRRFRRPRSSET